MLYKITNPNNEESVYVISKENEIVNKAKKYFNIDNPKILIETDKVIINSIVGQEIDTLNNNISSLRKYRNSLEEYIR